MDIVFTNTLSRQKEIFKPIRENEAGVYYCGPTVYWTQHIGNLRGATCADLIVRVLRYNNYNLNFVRNYTDVGHLTGDNIGDADTGEDRMEKAARREDKSPDEIARTYIERYEQDTKELDLLEPTHKPRATEHVQEMIEIVRTLLKKGFAYETDLAVYFDVSKAHDYTRLSGQDLDMNRPGAGTGDTEDPNKKHPFDFAIWFFAAGAHANALQTWPSPFHSVLVKDGTGFPGWHIECSAMSKKYLGPTFDIHIGGIEHIPVHHTNEIAQSESANGVRYVNYWLHNEHLLVDNKKMAKTEGTAYSLNEVIEKGFSPLSLRYLFLTAHYRSSQNFTWEALGQAETAYKKLLGFIEEHRSDELGSIIESYEQSFHTAINDDVNIPKALAVMWTMIRDQKQKSGDIVATLYQFDKALGLRLAYTQEDMPEISQELADLLAQRNTARENKDWIKADELRNKIESQGYIIKDTDKGSKLIKR
ncbi:MAG: cysteine--tRNA ligase [Candidatus Paceibacterota bacterium]|jgi:cysteinyl-tRNA synthetase